MNLAEIKKTKQLTFLIAASFIISVIAFAGSSFFIPDFSTNPPYIPPMNLILNQVQTAFLILGCTAYGIKLTEDKKTMPSIGFTMMAIAQGVIFVLFILSSTPSEEKMDETYRLFAASLYLLVPSMLIIALTAKFPKWLAVLSFVSVIPYIIENIVYAAQHKLMPILSVLDGTGQTLLNATVLFWAIIIYRQSKKEIAALQRE